MGQLENAVERLLQRNAQLEDHCARLVAEQKNWRQQRTEVLAEVELLLADLRLFQEQQG